MAHRTDQQHLYDLVEQIETNLKELKQILAHYPRATARTKKLRRVKSLYGVFPRTRTALADFRDARQGTRTD